MNLQERLRQLATALPSDESCVTLTRADLIALLEDTPSEPDPITRDFTIEDVAEEVGRAPSTVRSWLVAGHLRGYKLNQRAWRIPRAALREYLDAQGRKAATSIRIGEGADEDIDISAWRSVRDLT